MERTSWGDLQEVTFRVGGSNARVTRNTRKQEICFLVLDKKAGNLTDCSHITSSQLINTTIDSDRVEGPYFKIR